MASEDLITTGTAPFDVPAAGKPCFTFYKIFGKLQNGPPLIVVHGGPGAGHEYCLPFGKLWSLYRIPVVFYDQIGCAASTHLREKAGDRSFWNLELFVAELENLLNHLGINGGATFDVLGNSFGGIIATIFASRRPLGLRRLLLVGTSPGGELFFDRLWKLTRHLSTEAQDAINEAVRKGNFKEQPYLDAMKEFGRMVLCRADPWPPEELALDFKNQADDPTVRHALAGQSNWVYDGPLRQWDSRPYLPSINVPTFLIDGEFEYWQYVPTNPFFDLIPRVRWMTVAGASHMGHLDSVELQQKYLKLVGEFVHAQRPESPSP